MARSKVLVCILFLFLVNLVNGADFEIMFLREGYGGKDSVQVMILNNLTLVEDIKFGNIKLYKEERIPLALNLYKVDYGYFVFFDLPGLKNGSYNFSVEDVSYIKDGVLRRGGFSKNLSVEDLNYSLSVYPMFVSLSLEYWERPKLTFKLRNYLSDVNVSVSGGSFVKPRVSEIRLKSGEEYNLIVDIDQSIVEGFDARDNLVIDYGYKYEIPIYMHKKLRGKLIENVSLVKEEVIIIKEGLKFIEAVNTVNRTLRNDSVLEGSLRFKNFANVTLHGLRFNLTGGLDEIIRLEYKDLDFIDKDEEKYVILYVNEDKNINKDYKGSLVITTKEGVMAEFSIYLYFEEAVKEEVKEEPVINYSALVQKKEEKKSKLPLYIVVVVFIGLLIVVVSYFYRKGKPRERKFEELFER